MAVLTHNCIEFYEIYLAYCKAGGVLMPVNKLLRERELVRDMDYVKPRFIYYQAEFSELVEQVMGKSPFLEKGVCLGQPSIAGHLEYERLMEG